MKMQNLRLLGCASVLLAALLLPGVGLQAERDDTLAFWWLWEDDAGSSMRSTGSGPDVDADAYDDFGDEGAQPENVDQEMEEGLLDVDPDSFDEEKQQD